MKTIRELLTESLPPEIAEQAITNHDSMCEFYKEEGVLDTKFEEYHDTCTPLTQIFMWWSSPEGEEYWRDINNKYFVTVK